VHVQTSPVDPRSLDVRLFDSHGLDLDKQAERKLENLYFREDIRRVGHYEIGHISRREDANERYASELISKLDLETARPARVKVLVDYSNGAGAQVLQQVLQEMNCQVIPLNASPEEVILEQDDRVFQARLQEMGAIVQAVGARLGVFIDSPGVRLILIDEGGEVLDSSTSFAIFAQLSLLGRPGLLVGPASASLAFSLIAEQLESRFVATQITPGAVLRAAQHADTVLASDGEGGYCWPEFILAFDAMYSTAKLIELLATSPAGLSELRRNVPAVGYERRIIFCPWDAKGRVMRVVMERHLQDRVDLTDGVKVFVEDGWVLVVPDADKPEYLVIASTRDPVHARQLADEYAELVRGVVAEVLPDAGLVVERESGGPQT
jgi:mannose-1-phosphate guanylyltransferase/phosphomannomutase